MIWEGRRNERDGDVTQRLVTAGSHYPLTCEETKGKPCWTVQVVATKTELTEQKPRSHPCRPLLWPPPSPGALLEGGKITSSFPSSSNLRLMLPVVTGDWLARESGKCSFQALCPKVRVRIEKGECGAEEQETLVRSQVFPRISAMYI